MKIKGGLPGVSNFIEIFCIKIAAPTVKYGKFIAKRRGLLLYELYNIEIVTQAKVRGFIWTVGTKY